MADKETQKNEQKQPDEMLLKTRSILISGEINKDLADKAIKDLLILENESSEPVKIFINSPGGDVDAGYAIFDMIRFINAPVTTIGMGLVASAAVLVLLAVPAERRVGLPNSSYLIHQPMSGMKGVATDIEIHAKQLEKIRAKINRLISDETKKDLDTVASNTDRDYWLDSDEALAYGLISKKVEKRTEL